MENFYREKSILCREKNQEKLLFPPQKNVPVTPLLSNLVRKSYSAEKDAPAQKRCTNTRAQQLWDHTKIIANLKLYWLFTIYYLINPQDFWLHSGEAFIREYMV